MNVTKNLSAWFTYGIDHPQYADIFAAGLTRMRNQNLVGMVALAGRRLHDGRRVALQPHDRLPGSIDPLIGNQISLTGNYFF